MTDIAKFQCNTTSSHGQGNTSATLLTDSYSAALRVCLVPRRIRYSGVFMKFPKSLRADLLWRMQSKRE